MHCLVVVAIVPSGLEKSDMPDMVLTQKAMLERTSEWAEKAAALISASQSHSTHRASASDSSKDAASHRGGSSSKPAAAAAAAESLSSPLGSPTAVNPRDIPLELRGGGTARDPRDQPRDPRDRSPPPRGDREPGEIPDERLAARTEIPRRESRNLDSSGRQQRAVVEDRTEHKPGTKTDKDQEMPVILPKRDFDPADSDMSRDFDTRAGSSKYLEPKRTDSRAKLSPRAQSPSSKPLSASKKPSSGKLSSEHGPDDDAEPGMSSPITCRLILGEENFVKTWLNVLMLTVSIDIFFCFTKNTRYFLFLTTPKLGWFPFVGKT